MTTKRQPVYRDIDLTFTAHPLTGDVVMKTDAQAVVQSIKTLVLANEEEILGAPEIGGEVYGMLFGQAGPLTEVTVKNRIEDMIRAHEKRCDLKTVIVNRVQDGRGFMVTLVFYLLNNPEPVEVVLPLRRLR